MSACFTFLSDSAVKLIMNPFPSTEHPQTEHTVLKDSIYICLDALRGKGTTGGLGHIEFWDIFTLKLQDKTGSLLSLSLSDPTGLKCDNRETCGVLRSLW